MAKHHIATVGEIPENGGKLVVIERIEVGLFRVGDEYRAYRNNCPHAGAPLCSVAPGNLMTREEIVPYGCEGHIIRCPWHGWEFDLATGRHTWSEARLREYPVQVVGNEIFVELPV